MGSLKHIVHRRVHLERGQNEHRKNKLGPLEKHKDYKRRAERYHLNERIIARLEEKARIANPQEFNFSMTKSQVQDDGTVLIDKKANHNESNIVDKELKYVEYRLNLMRKKVDKDLPFVGTIFSNKSKTIPNNNITSSNNNNDMTLDDDMPLDQINKKKPTGEIYKKLSNSLDQINKLVTIRDKLIERKKVIESRDKKIPILKVLTNAQAVRIHKLAPERKR
ncbi:UTP11, U3 small nucleolar RNA-associated protein 11 [Babesia microti strain RI]|uniref:U3 small nucleolar RNA-associated protein 11 n=1 Tax=Babesia microti (strain RI) TaxID=1133968 RepID=I7J5V7_BABMR|nr:UTP11, U3 small nucleolar RNA-associated protein 11 [Babesia microti strain RI]CCF73252.1 UTP11, U3 small nucleolar RNA-associated protein 11 [Babesia microti strain RI]|eukprot:XP_012647861.1 UTP11, U3 small nucleolar RNA-associated protein 11 [Babesia microti strain RI]